MDLLPKIQKEKADLFANALVGNVTDMSSLVNTEYELELKKPEEYKKLNDVKNNPNFLTDNKSDEGKFNEFYKNVEAAYTSYEQNKTNSDFFFQYGDGAFESQHAREFNAKTIKNPYLITKVKDPFRQDFSTTELGALEEKKFTAQEIAQTQSKIRVKNAKGEYEYEYLGGKANTWNTFDRVLALAKDEKGDYVTDEFGSTIFEDITGQNPNNREIVSIWDGLTDVGSTANKFDFMDSNGVDKSATGIIMKNAVKAIPLAIGFATGTVGLVGLAYAIPQLIDGGAEMVKSIDVLAEHFGVSEKRAKGVNDDELANSLQGYIRRFTAGSQSEYANENPLTSLESWANMITDFSYQIAGQIGVGGAAVQGLKGVAGMFGKTASQTAIGATALNAAALYNGITSTNSLATEFEKAGFSDVEKAAWTLGATAGMSLLMRSDLLSYPVKVFGVDDGLGMIQHMIKKYAKKEFIDPIASMASGAAKEAMVMQAGSKAVTKLTNTLKNFKSGAIDLKATFDDYLMNSGNLSKLKVVGAAGVLEGAEEMVETTFAETIKTSANLLKDSGWYKDESKGKFKDLWGADYWQNMLISGVAGSVAGAGMRGLSLVNTEDQDFLDMVHAGKAPELLGTLENLHKRSLLGSSKLSIIPNEDRTAFKIADKDNISQNEFVYNRMKAQINALDSHFKAVELDKPSMDFVMNDYQNGFARVLEATEKTAGKPLSVQDKKRAILGIMKQGITNPDTGINVNYNTLLSDDLKNLAKETVKISQEIENLSKDKSIDSTAYATALAKKQTEYNALITLINDLKNKQGDYYLEQALFFANKGNAKRFNPDLKTRFDFKTTEEHNKYINGKLRKDMAKAFEVYQTEKLLQQSVAKDIQARSNPDLKLDVNYQLVKNLEIAEKIKFVEKFVKEKGELEELIDSLDNITDIEKIKEYKDKLNSLKQIIKKINEDIIVEAKEENVILNLNNFQEVFNYTEEYKQDDEYDYEKYLKNLELSNYKENNLEKEISTFFNKQKLEIIKLKDKLKKAKEGETITEAVVKDINELYEEINRLAATHGAFSGSTGITKFINAYKSLNPEKIETPEPDMVYTDTYADILARKMLMSLQSEVAEIKKELNALAASQMMEISNRGLKAALVNLEILGVKITDEYPTISKVKKKFDESKGVEQEVTKEEWVKFKVEVAQAEQAYLDSLGKDKTKAFKDKINNALVKLYTPADTADKKVKK